MMQIGPTATTNKKHVKTRPPSPAMLVNGKSSPPAIATRPRTVNAQRCARELKADVLSGI